MINLQKQPSQPPSPNSSRLFQKWWGKSHTVLWILTAFLSLFTCVRFNMKKYNPDPKVSAEVAKPSEPYLKVSENLIEREGYDCKVRKVYIETDSYWYIDTLSDWIRASKYPDMIMLSFEQNTTDGPRFGKIIIRSANRSHTITVIQHAVPLTIRPSKNSNNHYANSDENEETEYKYGDPDSPDYEGQRDKFGNYPEKDGKYPSKYGHHPDKYGPLDKYPYPKPQ